MPAENIYLNDFHRARSERLKEQLAKQPKATLEGALAQYERIKRGSLRSQNNRADETTNLSENSTGAT